MSQRVRTRRRVIVEEDTEEPGASEEAFDKKAVDTNKVPLFTEILAYAKKFSPSHQVLATVMVNKGVLTKKKFYITFIRNVVVNHFGGSAEVVSKIACTSEDLDDLVTCLFNEINSRLFELGLRLKSVTEEETEREMVVLVSEDVLPKEVSNLSGFSAEELTLFARYLPKLVEGGGHCDSSWALREASNVSGTMNMVKAQNFLDKLASNGWISEEGDCIKLMPRAIAELEPILTSRYGCGSCVLCQKVVVRKSIAVVCDSCEVQIHRHCWTRYAASSNSDEISCPGRASAGCNKIFSKNDMTEHEA